MTFCQTPNASYEAVYGISLVSSKDYHKRDSPLVCIVSFALQDRRMFLCRRRRGEGAQAPRKNESGTCIDNSGSTPFNHNAYVVAFSIVSLDVHNLTSTTTQDLQTPGLFNNASNFILNDPVFFDIQHTEVIQNIHNHIKSGPAGRMSSFEDDRMNYKSIWSNSSRTTHCLHMPGCSRRLECSVSTSSMSSRNKNADQRNIAGLG